MAPNTAFSGCYARDYVNADWNAAQHPFGQSGSPWSATKGATPPCLQTAAALQKAEHVLKHGIKYQTDDCDQ